CSDDGLRLRAGRTQCSWRFNRYSLRTGTRAGAAMTAEFCVLWIFGAAACTYHRRPVGSHRARRVYYSRARNLRSQKFTDMRDELSRSEGFAQNTLRASLRQAANRDTIRESGNV